MWRTEDEPEQLLWQLSSESTVTVVPVMTERCQTVSANTPGGISTGVSSLHISENVSKMADQHAAGSNTNSTERLRPDDGGGRSYLILGSVVYVAPETVINQL